MKSNGTIPPDSPTPQEVRDMRIASGGTQEASAQSVHVALRTWQSWEEGSRTMPAAAWELFLLRCWRAWVNLPPSCKDYLERNWGEEADARIEFDIKDTP